VYSSRPKLHRDWTPVHKISKQFTVDKRTSVSEASRAQFLIRNAIGSTFHQSQGLTIRDGALDFSKFPLVGKHCVGLSRFTSLKSFFILNLAEDDIRLIKEVKQEMSRLCTTRQLQLEVLPLLNSFLKHLTVLQHNSRSLHGHIDDVRADDNFKAADFIFLSKTWAVKSDPDAFYALKHFCLCRADCPSPTSHRHQCIAFLYHKKLAEFDIEEKITLTGLQILSVSISFPSDSWLHIIGLYKAHDFLVDALILHLTDALSRSKTACIIVGNFNVDLLKTTDSNTNNLHRFFSSCHFHQHVKTHTSNYGSFIHHCWSNVFHKKINTIILETYFSDHSSVACQIAVL
jgi:hypothetical protein